MPAVDIRSLNPAHLVGYVKESYTSFVGNITQTQANNELDAVRYQRSLNATNESLYPFTPVTNNESLYFKIGRYFYGEDDTSKLARARHLKHFYKELGYDLNDRENPIVAAIHDKVYVCTGFALRTDHERLAKKLNFVPNTPHDSPKPTNDVPLPGPESQVTSGSSQPLTQEALDMLDLTSAIANKPIGPMSDGSIAESMRAFAEDNEEDSEEDNEEEDVQNTPTPASKKGKNKSFIGTAMKVASAVLTGEDVSGALESDDDLSTTLKPTQPSGTESKLAYNPYPRGSDQFFKYESDVLAAEAVDAASASPIPSRIKRPRKPLHHSPLHGIKKASTIVGSDHGSEGEGEVS